jgi:hypothetical protein
MKQQTLTADRLREVLDYDKLTGVFMWRAALSNRVKIGDVAGRVRTHGYRTIGIDGSRYPAGSLAWFYVHGRWPDGEIDHKNTVRDDQRFENLRDVTHLGNMHNQRMARRNNKSGFLGVSPRRGKFLAQIRIDGKQRHIGMFETPELAHTAYIAAKRQFHATCTI